MWNSTFCEYGKSNKNKAQGFWYFEDGTVLQELILKSSLLNKQKAAITFTNNVQFYLLYNMLLLNTITEGIDEIPEGCTVKK